MKKTAKALVSLILATAGALSLAGCGNAEAQSDGDSVYIRVIDRPGGGTVECAFWVPYEGSPKGNQMDCNWEGANDGTR